MCCAPPRSSARRSQHAKLVHGPTTCNHIYRCIICLHAISIKIIDDVSITIYHLLFTMPCVWLIVHCELIERPFSSEKGRENRGSSDSPCLFALRVEGDHGCIVWEREKQKWEWAPFPVLPHSSFEKNWFMTPLSCSRATPCRADTWLRSHPNDPCPAREGNHQRDLDRTREAERWVTASYLRLAMFYILLCTFEEPLTTCNLLVVAHVSIVWHNSRCSFYCLLCMSDLLFIIYYLLFATSYSMFMTYYLQIIRATLVEQRWAPQPAASRPPPCLWACTLLQKDTRTQFII